MVYFSLAYSAPRCSVKLGRTPYCRYREYDSETAPKRPRSAEEQRLQKVRGDVTDFLNHPSTHPSPPYIQILTFESFRDLVHLAARGLSERQGLEAVQAEALEVRGGGMLSGHCQRGRRLEGGYLWDLHTMCA